MHSTVEFRAAYRITENVRTFFKQWKIHLKSFRNYHNAIDLLCVVRFEKGAIKFRVFYSQFNWSSSRYVYTICPINQWKCCLTLEGVYSLNGFVLFTRLSLIYQYTKIPVRNFHFLHSSENMKVSSFCPFAMVYLVWWR